MIFIAPIRCRPSRHRSRLLQRRWDFGLQSFEHQHNGAPYMVDRSLSGRFASTAGTPRAPHFDESIKVTIENGHANTGQTTSTPSPYGPDRTALELPGSAAAEDRIPKF